MFVIIAQNFALQLVSEGGITRVSTHIGTYFGQNTLEHTKMVCCLSFFLVRETSVRKGSGQREEGHMVLCGSHLI